MGEISPFKLTPTRLFLLVFFGLALVLSITTIAGSLGGWAEEDRSPPSGETAAP